MRQGQTDGKPQVQKVQPTLNTVKVYKKGKRNILAIGPGEILNPRKKQLKNKHKKIIKMILEKVFSRLKNLNSQCKCLPTTKRQNKTKNRGAKYKQI